jgi:hypothetical protein
MDLVHRDLKPSNIVIQNLKDLQTVKIVDFGLAVSIKARGELMSTCGTLIYQAPEQIFTNARQSKSIDMFSCGFILYEMLTKGKHPILKKGEDKQTYKQKIKEFKGLKIDDSVDIPPLAKNLIEQLCNLKPANRYKVEQALQHPWITGNSEDEIPLTDVHKFQQASVNF